MNAYEYCLYRQARIRAGELLRGKKLTRGERTNARLLFDLTWNADEASDRECDHVLMAKIYWAGKILKEQESAAA